MSNATACSLMLNATAWARAELPDPSAVLNEAYLDAGAGRYSDALAKHLWFHANALRYAPSLYGVRLSYNLFAWRELAEKYPRALEKLKGVRDDAEVLCQNQVDVRDHFHDFASINEVLGEDESTVRLFAWLDANRPGIAQEVHDVARRALLGAREYRLFVKYIEPDAWLVRMLCQFRENLELSKTPQFGPDMQDYAEKHFTNEATTLVALLVVTGRSSEAAAFAERLHSEWDDQRFHDAIRESLSGIVPAPWPPNRRDV